MVPIQDAGGPGFVGILLCERRLMNPFECHRKRLVLHEVLGLDRLLKELHALLANLPSVARVDQPFQCDVVHPEATLLQDTSRTRSIVKMDRRRCTPTASSCFLLV